MSHSKSRALRDGLAKLQVKALELAGEPVRPLTPRPGTVRLDARMTPACIAQLVAEYQAGTPTTELARSYGLGKGTVLRLLHEGGVRMRTHRMSDEQARQAVQLYEQGLSLATVGERLGFDAHTIHRILVNHDVPLRDRHGRQR